MAKSIYRADQVGSLLRPSNVLNARDAFKAGKISREALERQEDAGVLKVLTRQQQVGMPIFSDGEMRRDAWQTVFSQAVDGFVDDYPVVENTRPDGTKIKVEMHTKAIRGKLRAVGRLAEKDAGFLKQHAPGPFKITLASPAYVARSSYRPGLSDQAYPISLRLAPPAAHDLKASRASGQWRNQVGRAACGVAPTRGPGAHLID
jgi:5-methyltetrahydropteroyltriglutamate--homocysteine methyltransferase